MTQSAYDDRDVLLAGLRARDAIGPAVRMARENPAVFAQLVYRDDVANRPIRLAPMHEAWHGLMTRHDRMVLWSHNEAGKTVNVAVLRVLWEVGRNPNLRVLILSNTHGQAVRICQLIAHYVTSSPELHAVFPDLLPTRRQSAEPWQPLSGQITVRRQNKMKDATVTCSGLHGNITGARYDLVVMDDILDEENTHTPKHRRDTVEWVKGTVFGRLTARARVWIIGTAYHPDDALHYFGQLFSDNAREPRAWRYPVEDGGVPRWPEVWPRERIDRVRRERGSVWFARQMMCVARDDSQARFKREWIDRCVARGADRRMRAALDHVPAGCRVYTGVDLAVKQHAAADQTVFTTIMVHGNGDREVLCIEAGRWSGPEIVQRVVDVHRRFASIVVVEDVAAQEYILQFTRAVSAVPVRPFTTTARTKHNPEFGVESIAAEMEAGKWIVPSQGGLSPEAQQLVDGMLYYQPSSHTSDFLMSLWFAREAARGSAERPRAQSFSANFMAR